MFLDEARLVSRIEHPNVVRVTDVGEHHSFPYLVMELIEGEALDKLMQDLRDAQATIPLGIALRIATDACNGLSAAHDLVDASGASLNVVHRDVSPQNILVTTTGLAKVIDFGIAKGRDRAAERTSSGTLKGKASYMPREQALGLEVDARTDTWALGAVLYFLFAGRPPYKTSSQLSTLHLAMTGAPIAPLPPTVPAPVRALVEKALSHDVAKRFQTAAEMAAALEMAMRNLDAVASYNEVGTFVKKAMGARLSARRELVSKALAESTTRESQRLEAAIPVDLDLNLEGPPPEVGSSSPSWGAVSVSQSARAISRSSRTRTRLILALFAVLLLAVTTIMTLLGPRSTPRIAAAGPTSAAASPAAASAERALALEPPVVAAPAISLATASAAIPPPKPNVVTVARPVAPVVVRPVLKSEKPNAKNRDDEAGF